MAPSLSTETIMPFTHKERYHEHPSRQISLALFMDGSARLCSLASH
jgi:hypothetical protein